MSRELNRKRQTAQGYNGSQLWDTAFVSQAVGVAGSVYRTLDDTEARVAAGALGCDFLSASL